MNEALTNGTAKSVVPDLGKTSPEQWQAFCSQLLEEIDNLHSQVAMLREQRRQLLDSLVPDRHKHYDLDDDAILRNVGARPPFRN